MWIDATHDVPTPGLAVIGIWSEKLGSECGWVIMTDDGWYAANPDGSPVNRCPAPAWWARRPT